MTTLDTRLLAILRRNARLPISAIAAELGVSRATARSHMARLEAQGVIMGYTVRLASDVGESPVRAMTMLVVDSKEIERVVAALVELADVRAVHSTSGRWDLVVDLATDTPARLDATLSRLRAIPGVTATETSLLLATRHAVPSG